jgi:ABC-type uncharacterized transport system substrate-binding protein
MRRREFISLVSGAAVTWPLAVRAQQQSVPVIGVLSTGSSDGFANRLHAFDQALREKGYIEGRNVKIEYRFADDRYARLPALAADLVSLRPAVIVTNYPATISVKAATTTIPILFVTGGDPVKLGLVQSLNRPAGNVTGVSNLNADLGPKRLELVRELVPKASRIAILTNPNNPNAVARLKELQASADTLGLEAQLFHGSTEQELGDAFAMIRKLELHALVIGTDAFFINKAAHLGALSVRYSVPTIFEYREFAAAGGLLSYGTNSGSLFHILGLYAGRILNGEKPADLPVQQATNVELIINMKTAKALGLTVPLSLLGRADEVIE